MEVRDAWEQLAEDDEDEARRIKNKAVRSGSYDGIENLIERHLAKKASIDQCGFKNFNESQWEDRMMARGADKKEAAKCWADGVDRMGNKHPKVVPKSGSPYLRWKMPSKSIEEDRKEKELVGRANDRRFSKRAADAILGNGDARGTPTPTRDAARSRSKLHRQNARENLEDEDHGDDYGLDASDVECRDAWIQPTDGVLLEGGTSDKRGLRSPAPPGNCDDEPSDAEELKKWTPPANIAKKPISELEKCCSVSMK